MNASASECRCFHVKPGHGLRPLGGVPDALACRGQGGYVWIDLVDPTAEDLGALAGPNWRIAYPLFLLAMAVIGVANYYLLKWSERRPFDRPDDR